MKNIKLNSIICIYIWVASFILMIILNAFISSLINSPLFLIIISSILILVCHDQLLFSMQYIITKEINNIPIRFSDLYLPFSIANNRKFNEMYKNKKHILKFYIFVGIIYTIFELVLFFLNKNITFESFKFSDESNLFLECILLSIVVYVGVNYFFITSNNKISISAAIIKFNLSKNEAVKLVKLLKKRYIKEKVNVVLKKAIPCFFLYTLIYVAGIILGTYLYENIYIVITLSSCIAYLSVLPLIMSIIKAIISQFDNHLIEFNSLVNYYVLTRKKSKAL